MKKIVSPLLFILVLSCISGWLMSRPSLAGRVGIELFYKQYHFLRTWWLGALTVGLVLLALVMLQAWIHFKIPKTTASLCYVFLILLALGGWAYTYYDFTHTATHRMLKARFHTGVYLFWIGWILINIYFLLWNKKEKQKS